MKENVNLIIALCPILFVEDTGLLNKAMVQFFREIEPLVPRFRLFRAYP